MKELSVVPVVTTIVGITIGILLVGNLLVPTVQPIMSSVTSIDPTWGSLIGVVVVCTIIGLVVYAIRGVTEA